MAGIHSTAIPYYCARNGEEYLLWTANGENVVTEGSLRAAGFISDGGYLVVQDRQSGAYGVWSVNLSQLTILCIYQRIQLLSGQYEGPEAPPSEIAAAVLQDDKTWSVLRVYDGKTFISGAFDDVSTYSGLLAVRSGEKISYHNMRDGTAAHPGELSAWAVDEVILIHIRAVFLHNMQNAIIVREFQSSPLSFCAEAFNPLRSRIGMRPSTIISYELWII